MVHFGAVYGLPFRLFLFEMEITQSLPLRITGIALFLSIRHSKARDWHCRGLKRALSYSFLFFGSVVSNSTALGRHLPKELSDRRSSSYVYCHFLLGDWVGIMVTCEDNARWLETLHVFPLDLTR